VDLWDIVKGRTRSRGLLYNSQQNLDLSLFLGSGVTAGVLEIWGKMLSEKERLASVAIKSAKTVIEALITRKPCCRKETARCRSCSFRIKVRRRHSLQV